jgi:nucleoprotein TPR
MTVAGLSPRSRLQRCRAELMMLGDLSPSSQGEHSPAEAAAERRAQARESREAALQELRDRSVGAREEALGACGGSSSMQQHMQDRIVHHRREVDGLEAQLDEAEANNKVLENELLHLHEELARQRRDALRASAAAQEELRALTNKCADAWEEREDALELLDEALKKGANLHRELRQALDAREADARAAETQKGHLEAARAELQEAVQTSEAQLAAERVARLKAEDEGKMLRQQLETLRAERAEQGGQENLARAAAEAQLELETKARQSLKVKGSRFRG